MIDIEKEIRKTIAPLLVEPKVFTEQYKPSPLFRDEETRELMNIIKLGRRGSPMNAFIVGPPSTGKTLVMKLLYEQFNQRFEDMDSNMRLIYINLGNSSYYNALIDIITSFDPSYPQRGEATGIVEKDIMKNIHEDQVVGFILDEADRMIGIPPYTDPLDKLVCLLSRTGDKYDKKCFVILIANNELEVVEKFDDRTESSFSKNTIPFKQYNGFQTGQILWDRCQKGFKNGAIEYETVMGLGDRISSTCKDIRVGLKTLKRAAIQAEDKITDDTVNEAYNDAVRDIHKDIIETLDDTQLLLVYAIAAIQYQGMNSNKPTLANNARVYREYEVMAKRVVTDVVLSKHLFNYVLPKLQSRGIVSSYLRSFGRGSGRKKIMSVADTEEEVEKILNLSEQEIDSRFL